MRTRTEEELAKDIITFQDAGHEIMRLIRPFAKRSISGQRPEFKKTLKREDCEVLFEPLYNLAVVLLRKEPEDEEVGL